MGRLPLVLLVAVVVLGTGVYLAIRHVPSILGETGCTAGIGRAAVALDSQQAQIAATIAGVAHHRDMPPRALTVAYATAMQETHLHDPSHGDLDSVGVPTLDLTVQSPTAAQTAAAGPGGELVLFAKMYDVAPDGSLTLVHRLISPVRIAALGAVHIELPGIVHRFPAGHRLEVVVATSDAAYRGNNAPQTVDIVAAARRAVGRHG